MKHRFSLFEHDEQGSFGRPMKKIFFYIFFSFLLGMGILYFLEKPELVNKVNSSLSDASKKLEVNEKIEQAQKTLKKELSETSEKAAAAIDKTIKDIKK